MDVLIAGGGPARAIAALVLARAGVSVTIFDRARFPREKLCGDTVNPGALALLDRLGLAPVIAGSLPVDGMLVSGEGGVQVVGAYGFSRRGAAISRRILDDRLLRAAAAAGARIEEDVLVLGPAMTDGGSAVQGLNVRLRDGTRERFASKVTIAADGAQSRLAREAGLIGTPASPRRWAVGGVFEGISELSSFGEMHVRRRCYFGIAPLPGGLANACIVTAERALLRRRNLLPSFLAADPTVKHRFTEAVMARGPFVLGPLAVDAAHAGMPGLLLAGDAAGFVDPMTGDGLRFAFRGGELAGEEALRVLSDGWQDAHERLFAAREREFGAKWRFNRALRSLAASPAALRAAGASATIAPGILRRAICYAGDCR